MADAPDDERREPPHEPDGEPEATASPDPTAASAAPDPSLTIAGRPRRSLSRSTAVMASGTAVSRALGLVRNALLVAAIGATGASADAYDIANRLPNAFFAILAAGVLNAALVPQIVKAFQRADGERTVHRILTVGGVITLAATVVMTLTAQLWVELYTDEWPPQLVALATAFAYWCIPQLFFYGLYTLLGQVLNAREQFGPFMWAPVLNNIVSITGLVAFIAIFGRFDEDSPLGPDEWTPGAIALLAGTATLGIAAQALILIIPMVRGGYHWQWQWRGPKGELTTIGRVAAWALAAVGVEQVGVLLVTRVASAAGRVAAESGDGVVAGNAAYFQALSLYLVPHSLVTISLATAMYTAMARHAAAHDMAGLRADLSHGLRTVGVFTVFATGAMVVLAPYIVRVALPSLPGDEVVAVAQIMIAMTLGLVPLGATVLFKRVYFVLEDAKSIFFMHIPMTIAWVAVAYGIQATTDPRWWTAGVGLGLSASSLVGVLLRAGGLRRRLGGMDGRRVLVMHLKAALAAAASVAIAWPLLVLVPAASELSGWGGVGAALGIVAGGGTLMLAVYAGGLWALRVPEAAATVAPLLRRLGRT